MGAMRTVCVVVVAAAASSAGMCESVFDAEADALMPDVGVVSSLSSRWGGATYILTPGYAYNSSDSENLTLTTNLFMVGGFSEGISVDAGPGSLQPLLQGAGWWVLTYGTAELETTTLDEDGEAMTFEAATVGENGLGVRAAYSYIGADDDNLWIETSSMSLLFDYMRGGRVALNVSTSDLLLGPILTLYAIDNTVAWGVDWTQVLDMSGVWLSVNAGWSRIENRNPGAAAGINMADRVTGRVAFYPMSLFGVTVRGSRENGDTGDKNGYGGGIIVDMEQVRLSAEFVRTDVEGTPADSSEEWTVSLAMRF